MKASIEIPEEKSQFYYWVQVKCNNCGFQSSVAIYKKKSISMTDCPKCECESLTLDK